MHRAWLAVLLLLVAAATGLIYASRSQPSSTRISKPAEHDQLSRRALFERLSTERRLLVVYGTPDSVTARAYRTQAPRLLVSRWIQTLDLRPDTATTMEDLRGRAVVLLGTAASNQLLGPLSGALPVAFQPGGITFQDTTYASAQDVVSLLYPNPADPRYPVFVLAGNRDEAVLRHLEANPRVYDYQFFRQGKRIRCGHFAQADGGRWAFAPALDHDLARETRLARATRSLRFFTHHAALDEADVAKLARQREALYRRIAAFLNIPSATLPKVDYHLYPTLEAKALATDDMLLAHPAFDHGEVHLVLGAGTWGDGLAPEAALLARHRLGRPATEVLETGLAVYFSRAWRDKGYAYWATRLHEAGYVPPLSALVDNARFREASPLLSAPLAGMLVAELLEAWGRDTFLERYAAWQPAPVEIEAVEQAWHDRLLAAAEQHRAQIARDRAAFPAPPAFQKGFNFAHEGHAIHDGYASRRADSALARLAALGSNAVALLPYSFMRSPQEPTPLPFSHGAYDENDEALLHVALTARRLGLAVMLKPQLWLRGAWPGAIEMPSEPAWDRFFAYYEQWISHYALLAEMYRMELLCVGVELSGVTRSHPQRWAALAERLRRLYSGRLVYAANWGKEVEQLPVWDAFDYIGVSHYYPLSSNEAPTDEALRRGAETALQRLATVHRRYRKPVLLAEVGFPSIPAPWRQPHQEDRLAPLDLNAQARSYRAILQAVADEAWIGGLYWWKWPSDGRGGPGHRGFTPYGKPAEQVVAEGYRAYP